MAGLKVRIPPPGNTLPPRDLPVLPTDPSSSPFSHILQEFDSLLESTIKAPRLSGSKVARLATLSESIVNEDRHIVTALYKLNGSLPPATQARISSLYVFDAIARAAQAAVNKGVGVEVGTEVGKGTQAGLLRKLEGVVDTWVDGMVDDGRGGVWSEGKDKTRKIIDIWQKHSTFPQPCLDELNAKIASATSREGSSSSSSRKVDGKSSDHKGKRKDTGSGSTTPPYPPPASMLAGAVPAPAPVQPGLPPEIAKMLGIKGKPKSAGTDGVVSPPGSGGQPLDITALLASVTKSQSTSNPNPNPSSTSTPAPAPAQPASFTYPLPGQPHQFNSTNLPPAQAHLSALAALAGKNTSALPASRSHNSNGQAFPYTPSRDVFNRNTRDHDIANSLSGARSVSGPRSGSEESRSRSPGSGRAESGDGRRGRSRSPDAGRRRKNYDDGRQDHGWLGPPQHAQRGSGAADGFGLPNLLSGAGDDSGGDALGQHQAAQHQAELTKQALGGGGAGGQQPTLANFDLASFNPTLVESWAGLASAWRGTTGREPGQVELMHWLTTGQIMEDGAAGGGGGGGGMQGQGQGQEGQGQQAPQQQLQTQQAQPQPNSNQPGQPGPSTRGGMPNMPYPPNPMGPPPVPQNATVHNGPGQPGNLMGLPSGMPPIPPLSAGMPPPIVNGAPGGSGMQHQQHPQQQGMNAGMGMMGPMGMGMGMMGQGMGGMNPGMNQNQGMNQGMNQMGQMGQMGGNMNPMGLNPNMANMNMNMNPMGMGMDPGMDGGGQQWPGMSAGQWGAATSGDPWGNGTLGGRWGSGNNTW
ncbi:hypothetical protein IAT38_005191 [Cryptococcus sp. DSM 104549]